MVLAGDIGGTNVRLALFEEHDKGFRQIVLEIFPGRDYSGLEEVLLAFLNKHGAAVTKACIGVAGVVRDGVVEMTNLHWRIDSREMARVASLPTVSLLNDLVANAYGIAAMGPEDLETLHDGEEDPSGNRCMISAGTGLGEAGMVWNVTGHLPFHSEGGHVDFAPTNEEETDLYNYLKGRLKRVSYERMVSGPGMRNVYEFLRDTGRAEEPAWLADRLREKGTSMISATALAGESELCSKALHLFAILYGRAAGNLALTLMSTGGVYLGGGIAPNILPKLREESFREAFLAKGRLRPWLEKMPVRVILNDKAALLGAAWFAFHQ